MPAKVTSALMLLLLAAPLCLAPTGCVQEGGDAGPPPPVEEDLAPNNSLNDNDRIHFLRRTHFSFVPAELQRLNQMGFGAYLDWMLDLKTQPALESAALAATVPDPDFPSQAEIARWWIYLMQHNENPFQEVLAMFWHDHFAASQDILAAEARYWAFAHINLWRLHGTDNLAELLYLMNVDWLMLEWLDGVRSTRFAPNENFAREFWELFTLGADNGYTQNDIVEASKAFTGYRTRLAVGQAGPGRDQLIVEWVPNRHDNTTKTIFGLPFVGNGQAEYRDMVTLTLAQRPVAEFICRKIWEYFVYLNPSDTLVNKLAGLLRSSGYNLKTLFRTIFQSKAFFSAQAKAGIIKNPVEHVIGFQRATGLFITPTRSDNALVDIGQRPSTPPTVNGWPSGGFWLSSQGMLERANFLRDAVYYRNEAPQAGYDVGTLIPPNMQSADQVVQRLAWLLQVSPTPAQAAEYVDYLNTDRNGSGTIIAQPWNINDPVQREKKLRGLLYIMGQHPTYAIR
ncbi:MAG: DUF1800 domain-containing protein [Planctomycetes bacterium]|jgi:uncharacterized protein (DUF1800 family)|nr:DUF1800 domain-containing protein [Planctomycetota bacterium]MCL4730699.1 DUF1800 family protein [Planctomycetota bacterium]